MKPTAALRSLLTGSILLTTLPLQADNRYWKGGSDFWDTLLTYWGTSPSGPYASTWVNNDTAVFGGTAGTVTLTDNITVGGLRFDTTGYIIDANTNSKTLSFASGDNTILFNNIAAATINGTVGGSGNVILTASNPVTAGTLTLGLTSTAGWTGSTTINPGMTLALNGANRGLSSTSGITLNGGGISLTNTNSTQGAFDRVANGAGITSNGGTITYANTSVNPGIYAETIGSVALTNGQLNIVLNTSMAAGTQAQNNQTLTLGGLTQAGTSAITFSALTTGPQAASNRNMIVVSGAGSTANTGSSTGREIIGPWATTGTAAATQTDYAIYSSGFVIPVGITASAETNWTNSAYAYTSSGSSVALTGDRTMNALRNTGATAIITLSNGTTGYKLATNGILNGVNTLLTIAPGTVPGSLTAPGSSGGNLFLTAGGGTSGAITVNAPINDNGGAVTVVKNGSALLTLGSTTSNYSGGTVVNAGNLTITADSNLGATTGDVTFNGTTTFTSGNITLDAGRTVTVNSGAVVTLASTGLAIAGPLSGTGTISLPAVAANTFSNASGFTGTITNNVGIQSQSLTVDALGDGGFYFLGSQTNYGSGTLTFKNSSAATSFSTRQFVLGSRGSTGYFNYIKNDNANGSGYTVSIGTDMVIGGSNAVGFEARLLRLGGTNTDENKFTGKLGDGTGSLAGVITSLAKLDAGTWMLSGASSYTGTTTISAGTLVVNNLANGNATSSIGASTAAAVNVQLTGGTFKYAQVNGSGAAGHSTDRNFALVSNSTIDASGTGALVFSQTGTVSPDVTGLTFSAAGGNKVLTGLSSTANLVVGMSVTGAGIAANSTIASIDSASQVTLTSSSNVTAGSSISATFGYAARTLTLTGTNTDDNTIAGVLQNSTASTGALSLTKSGTGTWVLSGANTYTGTTTAGGGILKLNNATALPGGTAAAGGTSGLTITGGGIVGLTANSGNFLRARGTGTTQVQWTGSGGFAAYGGDRTVNLGGAGATAQWNNGSFVAAGSSLILSAADSNGTLIWENPINFAGSSRTIVVNNGSAGVDARFTAALGVSGGANGGLDKDGLGKLQTTADNIYTGDTTVTAGTLELGNNGSTGRLSATSSITVASGATLSINRSDAFSEATGLNDKIISGGGSFVQAGGGATTLNLTHVYTGTTTVSNGTLIVNGNISTSVLTTVQTGATLGGSGTVGNLTIDSGGTFSPGNSSGITTVNGNYIQNGQLDVEIDGLAAGTGAGYHDQVVVNGTVTLNGALNLSSFTGFTPVNGDLIFILLNDNIDAISGTYSGLAQGAVVGNYLGFDWQISYTGNSTGNTFTGGNDVVLMAVPEPRAALLGGIGLLMLLRRRRS